MKDDKKKNDCSKWTAIEEGTILYAMRLLARNAGAQAVLPLYCLTFDLDSALRTDVEKALVELSNKIQPRLIDELKNAPSSIAFKQLVYMLISCGYGDGVVDPLVDVMLSHADPGFRGVAIGALRHFPHEVVVEALKHTVSNDPVNINRRLARESLTQVS